MFDVFDKDFKKITIDYFDYLNSKVVASEYVDYETNTVKPNETGQIEIKHRMRRKMVNKDEYDLIDLHPDYRLSSTTRRIPFLKLKLRKQKLTNCWERIILNQQQYAKRLYVCFDDIVYSEVEIFQYTRILPIQ